MDVIKINELIKAAKMEQKVKTRLKQIFLIFQNSCEFKDTVEPLGFEGETIKVCFNPKHKDFKAMYTECLVNTCPFANYINRAI